MEKLLKVSSSPHVRDGVTTQRLMFDVVIAMIPASVYGVWQFGMNALLVLIATVIASVAAEYLYEKLMHKPITISDGSAVVTGMILALNMPPEIPQVSVSSPAETTTVTTAQTTSAMAVSTSVTTEKSVPESQISTTQTTTATTSAQTSKPAVTTAQTTSTTNSKPAETTARTTATTAPAEIAQELLPHELHKSDADNPDKITITTKLNEQGLYEDYFDYAFYDDPAVHGEWNYCTYIPLEALNSTLTADYIRSLSSDEVFIFSALNISDNGECECFLSDGSKTPCESRWTNGYLICDYAEGTAAQCLFEITIDGEKFLFAALKTGDFSRENKVYNYAVYTRAE